METTISAGAVFGTIAFVLIFLAAVVLGWWVRTIEKNEGEPPIFSIMAALIAVASVVLYIGSMWPFSWEYHEWRPTSGVIDTIDKRTMTIDGGMQERYVVRFTNGDERACDDTRCSLLKPGDQLMLKCKREFQWVGTDGWGCSYVDSKRR